MKFFSVFFILSIFLFLSTSAAPECSCNKGLINLGGLFGGGKKCECGGLAGNLVNNVIGGVVTGAVNTVGAVVGTVVSNVLGCGVYQLLNGTLATLDAVLQTTVNTVLTCLIDLSGLLDKRSEKCGNKSIDSIQVIIDLLAKLVQNCNSSKSLIDLNIVNLLQPVLSIVGAFINVLGKEIVDDVNFVIECLADALANLLACSQGEFDLILFNESEERVAALLAIFCNTVVALLNGTQKAFAKALENGDEALAISLCAVYIALNGVFAVLINVVSVVIALVLTVPGCQTSVALGALAALIADICKEAINKFSLILEVVEKLRCAIRGGLSLIGVLTALAGEIAGSLLCLTGFAIKVVDFCGGVKAIQVILGDLLDFLVLIGEIDCGSVIQNVINATLIGVGTVATGVVGTVGALAVGAVGTLFNLFDGGCEICSGH